MLPILEILNEYSKRSYKWCLTVPELIKNHEFKKKTFKRMVNTLKSYDNNWQCCQFFKVLTNIWKDLTNIVWDLIKNHDLKLFALKSMINNSKSNDNHWQCCQFFMVMETNIWNDPTNIVRLKTMISSKYCLRRFQTWINGSVARFSRFLTNRIKILQTFLYCTKFDNYGSHFLLN